MKIETLSQFMAENAISFRTSFVPFSMSRNAKEKHRSYNYHVTMLVHGREILTTDYSMGIGHGPKLPPKIGNLGLQMIAAMTESGLKQRHHLYSDSLTPTKTTVLPNLESVLASLFLDSDVINHSSFESWAADYGYDTDSRSAERTYHACLEIALKLKASLSPEAFQLGQELAREC